MIHLRIDMIGRLAIVCNVNKAFFSVHPFHLLLVYYILKQCFVYSLLLPHLKTKAVWLINARGKQTKCLFLNTEFDKQTLSLTISDLKSNWSGFYAFKINNDNKVMYQLTVTGESLLSLNSNTLQNRERRCPNSL